MDAVPVRPYSIGVHQDDGPTLFLLPREGATNRFDVDQSQAARFMTTREAFLAAHQAGLTEEWEYGTKLVRTCAVFADEPPTPSPATERGPSMHDNATDMHDSAASMHDSTATERAG